MNKIILSGKITNTNVLDKVVYCTVCTRTRDNYEYIPVTIFQTEYFKNNFYEGKWITIEGHIHINKHDNKYVNEIIVDNMEFCGAKTQTDKDIEQAKKDFAERNK